MQGIEGETLGSVLSQGMMSSVRNHFLGQMHIIYLHVQYKILTHCMTSVAHSSMKPQHGLRMLPCSSMFGCTLQ